MDKVLNIHKSGFYTLLVAIGFVITGGIFAFPLGYLSSANSLIGFCLLPFTFFINGKSRFNPIYFLLILFFGYAGLTYHLKISYFLTLAFYLLFCVELLAGKINPLALFLIVFMSPVFLQVSVIFGFPIRLYLSQWAGSILSMAGMDVIVQGNMMLIDGFDFAVDEACMGLSMLAISMLMGTFVLMSHYRAKRKQLPLVALFLFFTIVFILTISANLFRILVVVFFKILPDQPMHEVVGILCMVFYTMIPLVFISKWMASTFGREYQPELVTSNAVFGHRLMVALLGVSVMLIGVKANFKSSEQRVKHADVMFGQLPATKIDGGITKFFDGDLLVYVKPIPEFFTGEHTPLICWKGSGYEFKSIRKEKVLGHEIYMGTLQKEQEVLHTAWWYYNGKVETVDQMKWRSEMFTGGHRFNLVNVTAKDEQTLRKRLAEIFEKQIFKING